nr:hypothetical protein [Phytohabitans rumicis]
MSRPSTTTRGAAAMSLRCSATSSCRTQGTAATADTAPVTSGPRIERSTGVPFTWMCGACGSVPTASSMSPATLMTASASCGSTPDCSTAQVTARYIAPVSR